MATDKPFKTIDEQIELLRNIRHLTIANEEVARDALQRYGYYEIINGYKTPFLINPKDDNEGYKSSASFEHILDLYKFDRYLRKDLLESLEFFEQTFKQALSYSIASLISEDDSRYTAESHYNTGCTHHHKKGINNDRDRLLRTFDHWIHSNKQPFKHYREDHGNVPPWIMIKGLTFGQAIYWYRLSKPDVRFDVISRLLKIEKPLLRSANKKLKINQMIGDLLGLYLSYRNLSAHGGRVYNHRSVAYRLRWLPLIYPERISVTRKDFNHGMYRSSVGVVLNTLRIFDNPEPHANFTAWLNVRLENYLNLYPNDQDFLLKAMELNQEHTKFELNI